MLMKCRNYNKRSLVENRPKHKTYDNADANDNNVCLFKRKPLENESKTF